MEGFCSIDCIELSGSAWSWVLCEFVPFLWRVFASTFELLDFSWSLVMVISTGIVPVGGCVFVMYISYTISSGVFTSSSSSS